MARIKGKTINLKNSKQGQLFLLEVFISLTVLVLLMTAVYQVEFTTVPNYQDDLSIIGYNALESLNEAGSLNPLIYSENTAELSEQLDAFFSETIIWRLSVEDNAGETQFTLFWEREPPKSASVGVTEYFLYGSGATVDQFRVIHLELWRLLG
ncbi:MAG: hypothetical protein GF308_04395 [Candidatus Heimdallarchaeota archaeon]|nr:hypothetical protein [Candidatus Heimdallarchaeota archaeon]